MIPESSYESADTLVSKIAVMALLAIGMFEAHVHEIGFFNVDSWSTHISLWTKPLVLESYWLIIP